MSRREPLTERQISMALMRIVPTFAHYELTGIHIAAYHRLLCHLSEEDLQRGVDEAAKTSGAFFPTAGQILDAEKSTQPPRRFVELVKPKLSPEEEAYWQQKLDEKLAAREERKRREAEQARQDESETR